VAENETKGEGWLDIPGHLGWFVRYSHTATWLDFKAYEVIAEGVSPNPGVKYFEKPNARGEGEHVTNPDDAEPDIEGHVKWDGCCEMSLASHPHFCGAGDVEQYTLVMRHLHSLCLLLPSVDHDCAGYAEGARPGLKESEGQ